MSENLLQLGAEDLFVRLHQALIDLQLKSVRALSQAVEQHWAFAVARRDREKTRTLCAKLLEVASAAAILSEEHRGISAWKQRWLTLSEMGGLVLAVDAESGAKEDRERLKSFEHAEAVVLFLHQEGIAASSDIQRHLQEHGISMSPQSCWNHLSRLTKVGVAQRVGEGLYRLSPRGKEVAQILVQEKAMSKRDVLPLFVMRTYTEEGGKAIQQREIRESPRNSGFVPPRSLLAAGISNLVQHGVLSQGVSRSADQNLRDEIQQRSFLDGSYQTVLFGRQALAR